jgi:UDP-glucose 4-epimerase
MIGKVLITGGFGNLGSWLSSFFYDLGYEIYILSKSQRELKDIEYNVLKADIADLESLKSVIQYKQFDYCIHTASYNEFFKDGYAKDALMINTLGTRNLIEVLKDMDLKKFIYFSTFHVYGANARETVTEDTLPSPTNDYASTHLFAEYYLKQYYNTHKFPYITVRLTNSYGAPKYIDSTKWYLVLNDLAKSAYDTQKIIIKSNGTPTRDFISMSDVCKVTQKLLDIEEIDEIYNLSSNSSYSVMELAIYVQKVYKKMYNQEISITINNEDKNIYSTVKVSNKKLQSMIDYVFSNDIEKELHNIFRLLEEGK